MFSLLKSIRIKGTRRPRSRPKRVYANTKYNTPLVMTYLATRCMLQHTYQRTVKQEEETGKVSGVFDNEKHIQPHQEQRREVVCLDKGFPADLDKVRKIGISIPWFSAARVRHDIDEKGFQGVDKVTTFIRHPTKKLYSVI